MISVMICYERIDDECDCGDESKTTIRPISDIRDLKILYQGFEIIKVDDKHYELYKKGNGGQEFVDVTVLD
jgi:hypothetical protein